MDEDKEPFPSFAEWFKANRKKYATTSIARKMYSAKKIAHEKGAHNKGDKKMDEQEMPPAGIGDMAAVVNVLAELRELSEMDSSASRNLQRMGQETFFRVLADKLERAMEGQVASSPNPKSNMGPGELEEQEMQPTIKGKEIKIEKEPKFVKKEKPKKDKQTAKPSAPKLEEKVPGSKTFKVSPKGPGSLDQAEMDAETGRGDAVNRIMDPEKFLDKMIAKKKEKEPKKVALPKGPKLNENNETWYNSSLYESLKSKWTK
jgi:hypothetical protein